MPFPFLPGGAILAAGVLIGALTVFGLILRAMDRAIVGVRDTAVSSLVSGLRGWNAGRPSPVALESPGALAMMTAGPPATETALAGPPEWQPDGLGGPEIVDLGSRPIEAPPRRR